MRWPKEKIFLPFFVLLFLSAPLLLQAAEFQTAWVKRVVDGDTLLLTNGERVRLTGVDIPEIDESKKLYRDSQRSRRDIKTIKSLGRKATAFARKMVDKEQIGLEFDLNNTYYRPQGRNKEGSNESKSMSSVWFSL